MLSESEMIVEVVDVFDYFLEMAAALNQPLKHEMESFPVKAYIKTISILQ